MAPVVTPEFVATVADSIACRAHPDACRALAPDVEYRMREVVQDALKFARHSRRTYLTTQDVNAALKMRNAEPLYGFSGRDPAKFLRAAGHPDVYYVDDPDVSVASMLATPLPRPPVEVAVVPHWLAIDGRQPATPENAPPAVPARRAAPAKAAPAAAQVGAPPAAAPNKALPAANSGGEGATPAVAGPQPAGEEALVRAPLRHVLTRELQAYLDRVGAWLRHGSLEGGGALVAPSPAAADSAVLASLAGDAGLQPLLPYLWRLIGEEAGADLRELARLPRLMAAAGALLSNPALDSGALLHEALPPLLTALVARRLGPKGGEAHWGVRRAAARALATLCARYAPAHASLLPRVQRTLARPLADPVAAPPEALHGAALGLAALGPRSVRSVLTPLVIPVLRRVGGEAEEGRVRAALAAALGGVLAHEAALGGAEARAGVAAAISAYRRRGGRAGPPRIPDGNPLAEAWREDFGAGKLAEIVLDLFGQDIEPFLPPIEGRVGDEGEGQ
ncbi:hypothetical protein ACKKBF_B33155 [Auxenochlorella protothecoides x Auxenochlorella symbiontica]